MLRFELINAEDIDKYVFNKRAMIVDVRSPEEFKAEHIEDAVNIPFERLEKNYNKMPRDLISVLYDKKCGAGVIAAKELYDRGYIVKAVVGGISEYKGKYLVKE